MVTKRPLRVIMVTFDLINTLPGDDRYRKADQSLEAHGNVFKPIKQIRLIITRSSSQRIKYSLEQQLGHQASILIIPIKSIPAWRVQGIAKRREWIRFVEAVEAQGLEVDYLTRDARGGA